MRKHDVRKWLHAILDLLPVILIPVFMVYSHRHDINNGSVEVQENLKVDFNQQVLPFTSSDVLVSSQINIDDVTSNAVQFDVNSRWGFNFGWSISFKEGHTYYIHFDISNLNSRQYVFALTNQRWTAQQTISVITNDSHIASLFTPINNFNTLMCYSNYNGVISDVLLENLQINDLTQAGISKEQYDILFTDTYYNYSLSDVVVFSDYSTVTYNDTDIMSQMTYQLYNATDKYFNMDKAFNLGSVHQWFNNNIFNGQPPLYINVVWHIIAYEFLMDLMFLLYALFMWFIDMVEKLMEKPLKSVK